MKILSIASFFSVFLVSTATASDIVYIIERNMSTRIGDATLIKAQKNNLDIGCIGYTQDTEKGPCIFNFYVDQSYRKNGIGSQLIQLALNDIKAQNKYTSIRLTADPHDDCPYTLDKLCNYYAKFGFQITCYAGYPPVAFMKQTIQPQARNTTQDIDATLEDVLSAFEPKIVSQP